MEIKFIIDSKQRKPMAHTISELSGYDVEYLGAPSFAYRIGADQTHELQIGNK